MPDRDNCDVCRRVIYHYDPFYGGLPIEPRAYMMNNARAYCKECRDDLITDNKIKKNMGQLERRVESLEAELKDLRRR